jgi:copper resistance protein C
VDPFLRGARSHAALAVAALLLAGIVTGGASARAHAFPDHSEPRVGHTLDTAPDTVRVWFDGDIEPIFSTMRVETATKQRIDKGDPQVDPGDSTLLEVHVPPLPSGEYHVFWSVVARDGHRTEGSFPFQIR